MTDAPPFDTEWEQTHVLRFEQPGCATQRRDLLDDGLGAAELVRQPADADRSCAAAAIDTTDQALDIVVSPAGDVALEGRGRTRGGNRAGRLRRSVEAARVRAEGERVIAAAPWPTGWEDWRPPAAWGPLDLPQDSHVV